MKLVEDLDDTNNENTQSIGKKSANSKAKKKRNKDTLSSMDSQDGSVSLSQKARDNKLKASRRMSKLPAQMSLGGQPGVGLIQIQTMM